MQDLLHLLSIIAGIISFGSVGRIILTLFVKYNFVSGDNALFGGLVGISFASFGLCIGSLLFKTFFM